VSIATGLAAARQYIRATLATITILGGYDITIKSAAGKASENPLKTPDSMLPKAWALSSGWTIRPKTVGAGGVESKVDVDVWFLPGSDPGGAEEYEEVLNAVVMAFSPMAAPAGTTVRFDAERSCEPGLTAGGRATLRIPMVIEATYSRR